MTPQEIRKTIINRMRTWASDLPDWMGTPRLTKDEVKELVQMFDDAALIAEEFLGDYIYGYNDYPTHVARNLIFSVGEKDRAAKSLDNLPIYEPSDDVLEHVEANEYILKPEFDSVWIGVGSIVVYVHCTNGQVVVELQPNNDELESTVYDSCSAYQEEPAPRRVYPVRPITLFTGRTLSHRTFDIDEPFDVVHEYKDKKQMHVRASDGNVYLVHVSSFKEVTK